MIVTSACDRRVHRCAMPAAHPAEGLVAASDAGEIRALLALTDRVERHRANEPGARICSLGDDYVGPYPEYVLAPFAYPHESRFSDGTFGVLYAVMDFETAARESAHWLTKAYLDSSAPAGPTPRRMYLTMRVLGSLADARGGSGSSVPSDIYDPDDYTLSQTFGLSLHAEYDGFWYDSVRQSRGECIGVFVPRIISDASLQYEVEFEWDGKRFANFKSITPL